MVSKNGKYYAVWLGFTLRGTLKILFAAFFDE
jgi:hypothetical protein